MLNNPMPSGGKREGAGRPQKYGGPTISFTLRLPKSIYTAVVQYSKKKNISKSEAVIKIMKDYFKHS